MSENTLKIGSDLAAYIKSIVKTEIAIHDNANSIPTYSLYSYNAMSTSSVDSGVIVIDGQDIRDYCEETKMIVNNNTSMIGTHESSINEMKKDINNKVAKSDFEDYQDTMTSTLNNYVKNETLNDYVKNETLNNYVLSSTLNDYAKSDDLDNYISITDFEDYKNKMDTKIAALEARIAALEPKETTATT